VQTTGSTLKDLIVLVYDVRPDQIQSALLAQEFEVATIKPSAPGSIAKSFRYREGHRADLGS
jgi:hypothetical protein